MSLIRVPFDYDPVAGILYVGNRQWPFVGVWNDRDRLTTLAANLISGNDGAGISIIGADARSNLVEGNFIGTDVTGSLGLKNELDGVQIRDAAHNTIGGLLLGSGNIIAFNELNGIGVGKSFGDRSVWNSIRGNSIFGNGSLGIDLGGDGVTANDELDADSGPNSVQNTPIITSALINQRLTQVAGTLNNLPNEELALDFYANSEADVSNSGEGERYLGSAMVSTDPSGDVSFDVTLKAGTRSGEYICATATDSMGGTSEFSEVILVSGGGPSAPAPFKSAVELGAGWLYSDWFGTFNISFVPWVFHSEHSWMFVSHGNTLGEILLYDLNANAWHFTKSASYPSMYSFGRNAWIFYFIGTSRPRQFVNLESGDFFSIP